MKFSMKRSLKILDGLTKGIAKKFKERAEDNTPLPEELHVPQKETKLDKIMMVECQLHQNCLCVIQHDRTKETPFDMNETNKALGKELERAKKTSKVLSNYKINYMWVKGHDYICIDVKYRGLKDWHRHLFKLSPNKFVETSHFYDTTEVNSI